MALTFRPAVDTKGPREWLAILVRLMGRPLGLRDDFPETVGLRQRQWVCRPLG